MKISKTLKAALVLLAGVVIVGIITSKEWMILVALVLMFCVTMVDLMLQGKEG